MCSAKEDDELVLDFSDGSDKNYSEELEEIVDEWSTYRKALRGAERDAFDKMVKHAKVHERAGKKQDQPRAMETFFISVILEQQMEIMRLKRKLEGQKEVDEEF